jgi:hypothetical protein
VTRVGGAPEFDAVDPRGAFALNRRAWRGEVVREMSEQSATGAMTRAVAAMLAPTLGWDRSVEVVVGALRRLGLKDEDLGSEERRAVLEDLSHERGSWA